MNRAADSCASFLGPRPPVAHSSTVTIGSLSVVGSPASARLDGDGIKDLYNAEACTDVTLNWNVEAGFCHGSADASLRTDILDGEDVLVADAGTSGSTVVNTPGDVTYGLIITTMVEGEVCHKGPVGLEVQRHLALHPTLSNSEVDAGDDVVVTVVRSCPAPAGGVEIAVESSNAARLPGAPS